MALTFHHHVLAGGEDDAEPARVRAVTLFPCHHVDASTEEAEKQLVFCCEGWLRQKLQYGQVCCTVILYVNTHTQTHRLMWIHHVCAHAHIPLRYISVCRINYISTYTCTWHAHMHTRTHTHARTHTRTRTRIHTHTHTTNTPMHDHTLSYAHKTNTCT